jgi:hypothetical protein
MMLARSAVLLLTILISFAVRAWNGEEHESIGAEAYAKACGSIPRPEDAAQALRWDLACGRVTLQPVGERVLLAERFGEACSLAGDHVGQPEDLLARLGGRTASSPIGYGVLAMTNFEHFHPTVRTSWRTFHERATATALKRTPQTRYALEATLFQALSEEAFAAHYLQDAFAAGHMGVNRPASSVSAVLGHHNRWNKRGRCVANARGNVWTAYGDGQYSRFLRDDWRSLKWLMDVQLGHAFVVEATAASVRDVIRTFVFQVHHEDGYAEAAGIMPSFGGAESTAPSLFTLTPTLVSEVPCANLPPELYEALDRIGWPAEVTGTVDTWWFADRVPREDGTINTRGVILGYSLAGLIVPLGHRRVATRAYFALGKAVVGRGEEPSFFFETGYLVRVGMSQQGLIVYEVGVGTSAPWQRTATYRLILGGNIELGGLYLRVQVGPAAQFRQNRAEWGPFYTIGIGRVVLARVIPGH